MTPKASFVIPVKNGAAYLAECLESCLKQTVKNIEIVAVNDGSDDSTGELLDFYVKKDKRVRVVTLPQSQGRSLARNAGLDVAEGDFLFMQDADDIATPNRVRDTLNFFKKNPRLAIAYGEFSIINDLGVLMATQPAVPFNWEKIKKDRFFYIGHSTMAFRRRVIDKIKYTDGPYSEHGIDDWKFQLDAHKAGFRFGAIPRNLCHYRYIPKVRDEGKILELKEACLS